MRLTDCPGQTLSRNVRLKYPEASDWVLTYVAPSEAATVTSAIGSCLRVSSSRRMTAPCRVIDLGLHRCLRGNNCNPENTESGPDRYLFPKHGCHIRPQVILARFHAEFFLRNGLP